MRNFANNVLIFDYYEEFLDMDWSSWISAGAAVLSVLGGTLAYYQAHFSKRAKSETLRERKLTEQAEKRAVEAADLARHSLDAMDKQTAVFREQVMQLEAIAKAVESGSSALEDVVPATNYPYIERIGKNRFAIINMKETPLEIEYIRNRDEFVRIDLEDSFVIDSRAQKTFLALGALEKPLPDNLILDEVGQDQPLHLALPCE